LRGGTPRRKQGLHQLAIKAYELMKGEKKKEVECLSYLFCLTHTKITPQKPNSLVEDHPDVCNIFFEKEGIIFSTIESTVLSNSNSIPKMI